MRLAALVLAATALSSVVHAAEVGPDPIGAASESGSKKRLSDAQIKKHIIDESIAAYDGNCPCPYSRASNGSRCGKRSAYNREGGAAPLCYPEDVSKELVQAYRDTHAED